MATASAASIRAQVLIGRLQMQEQRIASVNQQLAEVQSNVAALEQAHDATVARTRVLQDARGTAEQREANERELDALAASDEIDTRRLAELHNQEAMLQGQVDQEQARWHDVNTRLEDLEQSLAR
jgi:chromosome segregation ATPase